MGRQQDRLSGLGKFRDRVPKLPSPDRIETYCRLVEHDDRRVVEEASGDVEPLLHPARVALDALLLASHQAHELQELGDPPLLHLRRHAVELGEIAEVVKAAQPLVRAAVAAEDVADVPPHGAGAVDNVVPQHAGRSRGRDQQRHQHLDRGRLSGAVRPEQAKELALVHLEVDSSHCLDGLRAAADEA